MYIRIRLYSIYSDPVIQYVYSDPVIQYVYSDPVIQYIQAFEIPPAQTLLVISIAEA